ncbi:VOC family protein [Variovorax sp. AFSI2.2]|uniref:VOC family protein n=1 Tax=Variovorax sp. AFSI2.2 TaxID=3384160 RepID=UPI003EB997B1
MHAQLDHLVIAAASLAEGVAWCEATLGVTPGPGGSHPLMGTHNRLLNIASAAFPQAYLEIIAIEPGKRPSRRGTRRWFDLDDAALQAGLLQHGPRLVHFVARVADAHAALRALAHDEHAHIDRGHLLEASRDTPAGRLEWQITVRDDGQRLFYGALPTLIQWGPVHPTDAMPASGLAMRSLHATHPRAAALDAALSAIGMSGMAVQSGAPNLVAVLDTPHGPVTLQSEGL